TLCSMLDQLWRPDMAVIKIARYEVAPGSTDAIESAIVEFADYVQRKLGDSSWTTYRDRYDPTRYVSVIIADDEEADRRHREASGTVEFAEKLYPNVIGDVVFTEYDLVASSESHR
ncbi:MAG TPA: hypothetical protein VEB69_09545, partial [Acidimicrobiia bacterium]|nr:hypothetical protein [Acidimicrobiia bacterium]